MDGNCGEFVADVEEGTFLVGVWGRGNFVLFNKFIFLDVNGVVVGRDGSGNDDASCIDGRGSEEDDETTGVSGCDNDNGNENFNVLHVRSRQHTD